MSSDNTARKNETKMIFLRIIIKIKSQKTRTIVTIIIIIMIKIVIKVIIIIIIIIKIIIIIIITRPVFSARCYSPRPHGRNNCDLLSAGSCLQSCIF